MIPWMNALLAYGLLSANPGKDSFRSSSSSSSSTSSLTKLAAFWNNLLPDVAASPSSKNDYCNSDDSDFPWKFEGRAVLCPMIVQLDETQLRAKAGSDDLPYQPWSLGGWSIGGVVALEYDDSPVGPYIEYVDLGCFASLLHQLEGQDGSRFILGQVGSRLYVNEPKAMTLCEQIWNLEALRTTDEVVAKHGNTLSTYFPEEQQQNLLDKLLPAIPVTNIPLWWTPTITAIWAQLTPRIPWTQSAATPLSLNRLRISGKAKFLPRGIPALDDNKAATTTTTCISLGFGIAVDNVLIEISDRVLAENDV